MQSSCGNVPSVVHVNGAGVVVGAKVVVVTVVVTTGQVLNVHKFFAGSKHAAAGHVKM